MLLIVVTPHQKFLHLLPSGASSSSTLKPSNSGLNSSITLSIFSDFFKGSAKVSSSSNEGVSKRARAGSLLFLLQMLLVLVFLLPSPLLIYQPAGRFLQPLLKIFQIFLQFPARIGVYLHQDEHHRMRALRSQIHRYVYHALQLVSGSN